MGNVTKIRLIAVCLDELDRLVSDQVLVLSPGARRIAVSRRLDANIKPLLQCRGLAGSQMPLPEDSSRIAGPLQDLGQRLGAGDKCRLDLRLDKPLASRVGSAR